SPSVSAAFGAEPSPRAGRRQVAKCPVGLDGDVAAASAVAAVRPALGHELLAAEAQRAVAAATRADPDASLVVTTGLPLSALRLYSRAASAGADAATLIVRRSPDR